MHVYICFRVIDEDKWGALQERFKVQTSSSESVIRDVYDGRLYRKHHDFLSHPANVSLAINTDGVAVFRSSTSSVWPVWVQVNELPKSKR